MTRGGGGELGPATGCSPGVVAAVVGAGERALGLSGVFKDILELGFRFLATVDDTCHFATMD